MVIGLVFFETENYEGHLSVGRPDCGGICCAVGTVFPGPVQAWKLLGQAGRCGARSRKAFSS